jgi:hypothetical protein
MREHIRTLLGELRFAGMAESLERILDTAEQAGDAPAAVLLALLREEARHRQERSLAYRLQQAPCPGIGPSRPSPSPSRRRSTPPTSAPWPPSASSTGRRTWS